MKKRITVEIDITLHEDEEGSVIPFLHETVAEVDDEKTDINRIGVSIANPFVFYLFSKDEDRAFGGFVATINGWNMMQDVIRVLPELREEARANVEQASSK